MLPSRPPVPAYGDHAYETDSEARQILEHRKNETHGPRRSKILEQIIKKNLART